MTNIKNVIKNSYEIKSIEMRSIDFIDNSDNEEYINLDVVSESSDYEIILDLGLMPFVNNLEETYESAINCEKFPLSIVYFSESQLTRIEKIPNSKRLFDKYLYVSGISKPFKEHCSNLYIFLKEKSFLKNNDLVLDIGGNDGTLLCEFRNKNETLDLINIEPSSVYKRSADNNIKTLNQYFDKNVINILNKSPNLIITTNVFQHLFDIREFAQNIYDLLDDNGFWCLEFPYLLQTMKTFQFDQIYHEHIYYYNVSPLYILFNQVGLRIIDVSEQFIHGGSLRLIVVKENNKNKTNDSVNEFLLKESNIDFKFYKNWSENLDVHLKYCKDEIDSIAKDKTIYGFGAAAKGCVFLNYLKIDSSIIKYVIDDTDIKQNKFIPGVGIKVIGRNEVEYDKIDFIIILAHNFSEYIVNSLRADGYRNKFIVCFPEFKII